MRLRGEVCVDTEPAKLQGAHEEPGHQEPALRAVLGAANDIQGQARLHPEHARHIVEQDVAQQCCDDQPQKGNPHAL